jgi:hypothetical protein
VGGIAVAREDDDPVPALLQSDRRIHDQPLGASDPEVRVQKDYGLGLFLAAGHLDGLASVIDAGQLFDVEDVSEDLIR